MSRFSYLLKGIWATSVGNRHHQVEYKHPQIILRWNVGTQSIILDGEQANNVKDELSSLAEQDKGLFDEDDTSDEELEPSHTDDYNGEANANQH